MTPKYRIWHKAREQMFEVRRLDFVNNDCEYADEASLTTQNWVSLNNVILMQSTGLTAANGVEIFEGDIVDAERERERGAGVVEIKVGHAPQITYKNGNDLLRFVDRFAVVLGNIHQNPELLEK